MVGESVDEAVLDAAMAGLSVAEGQQKTLAPWLFYDERGSVLFEKITDLPEYYLTRTERGIFEREAAGLARELGAVTVVELGAGSASKTGVVLRALAAELSLQQETTPLLYQPVDISPSALEEAKVSLGALMPGMDVRPQVANYITETFAVERPEGCRVLAMYIGSSIGNFAPEEQRGILENLRAHLEVGDSLLLGVDLAPSATKPVQMLCKAYDDAQGVTAAFNRNVLVRLNRELGADFAVDCYAHRARWNAAESRMEMHLESLIAQTATLLSSDMAEESVTFARGETIHTENSYKFSEARMSALLESAGFVLERVMQDEAKWFAVGLGRAV